MMGMPKRTPTDHTRLVAAHFSAWLRAHRIELGLTQERLAQLSGVERNHIQNLEKNRNNNKTGDTWINPGLDTILALEAAFGMEVGELLLAVAQRMKTHPLK